MTWNFLRSLLAPPPRRPISRRRSRLALECLEGRFVPATVTTLKNEPPTDPDHNVFTGKDGLESVAGAVAEVTKNGGGTLSFAVSGTFESFYAIVNVPVTVNGGGQSLDFSNYDLGLTAPGCTISNLTLVAGLIDSHGGKCQASNVRVDGTLSLTGGHNTASQITGKGSLQLGGDGNTVASAQMAGGSVQVQGNGNKVAAAVRVTGNGLSVTGDGNIVAGVQVQDGAISIFGKGNTVTGATLREVQFPTGIPFFPTVGVTGSGNTLSGLTVVNAGLSVSGDRNVVRESSFSATGTHPHGGAGIQGSGNTLQTVTITGPANQSPQLAADVSVLGPRDDPTKPGNVIRGLHLTNGGLYLSGNNNRLLQSQVTHGQVRLVVCTGNVVQGNVIQGLEGFNVLFLDGSNANTVGGTTAAQRNVIAMAKGSAPVGIELIQSSKNRIQGNYIGTDRSGNAAAAGHLGVGIEEDALDAQAPRASANHFGGTTAGAGNLIAGNIDVGMQIAGNGAVIQGNTLGLGANGKPLHTTSPFSDGGNLNIFADGLTVGGTAAGARNIVGSIGVHASRCRVEGNYVGTDRTGQKARPYGGGVSVDGTDDVVGGTTTAARNVIAGTVSIGTTGTRDRVVGNYIGLDAEGTHALRTLLHFGAGVEVDGSGNSVGGTTAAQRNIISGAAEDGVYVTGSKNLVEGNFIGTDKTGKEIAPSGQPIGNTRDGVRVTGSDNTIGGTKDGAGNVICGNSGDGVHVEGDNATKNVIAGNFIGTNEDGTDDLGNRGNGVAVIDAPGNTIGGSDENAGNVIGGSGNTDGTAGSVAAKLRRAATAPHSVNNGIFVYGAKAINNKVQGDFIGITQEGKLENNKGDGVRLEGASKVTVGGTSKEVRNVISANKLAGVHILNGTGGNATHNLVQAGL